MTKFENIDRPKQECDSSNELQADICFAKELTNSLGCNLPWNPNVNGTYLDIYFKYLSISQLFFFDVSENLAICSKDAQFLKYYNLIKDLPDEFYKKIQKCEIPRCHTNRYNSFDFLDTVRASNDTICETTHNFKIRASEVSL